MDKIVQPAASWLYSLQNFEGNLISEVETFRQVANMERREMHTGIWWGNLKERDQKEQLSIYGPAGKSSVGIATHSVLDGPAIESRWEARFSAPVQTGPGAYSASYTMSSQG